MSFHTTAHAQVVAHCCLGKYGEYVQSEGPCKLVDSVYSDIQVSTTASSNNPAKAPFCESVYGSRFEGESLPDTTMPEEKMPKEVAYRMIKDHVALDGNPALNLASFVSTYMEEEAERLMVDALGKNFVDHGAYPQTADIERRCVGMLAELYHAPRIPNESAIGTSTIGSSEAIMLCTLALKRRWAEKRETAGHGYSRPNVIMNSAVQVCWQKAANYFGVETRYVYCTMDRYVIDVEQAVSLVDENTIGICCILGTTYTGEYEDVKGINDALVSKNLDVPIHVDAASGGFVAPFLTPELEWDFRLQKVVSINVSGHKYGLVYPGVGWAIWRSSCHLAKDLVFDLNYLGTDQATFTLNFSKGSSHVLGQYYQLIRLGKSGYREIMKTVEKTATYLSNSLEDLGFIIMSSRDKLGIPVVAFRIDRKLDWGFDEFALTSKLREKGWLIPAYTMAANAKDLKLLRIVCRYEFSRSRCDSLVRDMRNALKVLKVG